MTQHLMNRSGESEWTIEELKAQQEMLSEKAERKRLESYWWAAVLIWSGLIVVAELLGILPEIGTANAWSWIFLGAGVFGLIGALMRVIHPDLPKPTGWDYFWSILFLIIGSVSFFGGGIAFPIVLLVVGIAILANAFFGND